MDDLHQQRGCLTNNWSVAGSQNVNQTWRAAGKSPAPNKPTARCTVWWSKLANCNWAASKIIDPCNGCGFLDDLWGKCGMMWDIKNGHKDGDIDVVQI